jgi:hypothetical protein
MLSGAGIHTLDLSRRGLLRGLVLATGAGVLLTATPAAADSKFSQKMAKYQPGPKGQQQCDSCGQFVAPASCKVVDGKISPSGWCFLYAHK